MAPDARQARRYDGTLRRERAARTRDRVLTAAHKVFVEHGYAATTIPRIAEEAGVAVETVYRSAPGKAGLLAAALEIALAGGSASAALPVEGRKGIRRVIEEPDPRRKLELYAATQPGLYGRAGALLGVLDEAAPGNPELASLRRRLAERRLTGLSELCASLTESGALRGGLTAQRGAEIITTVCSLAAYLNLVGERNWTPQEFQEWAADTLALTLLGPEYREH